MSRFFCWIFIRFHVAKMSSISVDTKRMLPFVLTAEKLIHRRLLERLNKNIVNKTSQRIGYILYFVGKFLLLKLSSDIDSDILDLLRVTTSIQWKGDLLQRKYDFFRCKRYICIHMPTWFPPFFFISMYDNGFVWWKLTVL